MTEISSLHAITSRMRGASSKLGGAGLAQDVKLRAAAEKLEATFLSEMLKSAGVGEARESFGGGAGEAQFASFLRDAQADAMVRAGGIGLADELYATLKERQDGQ